MIPGAAVQHASGLLSAGCSTHVGGRRSAGLWPRCKEGESDFNNLAAKFGLGLVGRQIFKAVAQTSQRPRADRFDLTRHGTSVANPARHAQRESAMPRGRPKFFDEYRGFGFIKPSPDPMRISRDLRSRRSESRD
jgi:hypothetical protein